MDKECMRLNKYYDDMKMPPMMASRHEWRMVLNNSRLERGIMIWRMMNHDDIVAAVPNAGQEVLDYACQIFLSFLLGR